MAQTAVDLPDPLGGSKTADTGAAFKSADDLLAQLAGDEVDRLLAEADASTPGPLNVDVAVTDDPSVPIELEPVSDAEAQINDGLSSEEAEGINELFKLGNKEGEAAASEAAPAPAADEDKVEAAPLEKVEAAPLEKVKTAAAEDPTAQTQRATAEAILQKPAEQPPSAADALAKEMEEDERAHAAAVARMKQPAASPEPIAASAKPAVAEKEPVAPAPAAAAAPAPAATPAPAVNAAAEAETVLEAPSAVIDEDEVDLDAEPAEQFQTPLLVRVLEWINAPLSGLSDAAREAVGKVALVTTLNAVAVLTYVLLFRRHH